MISKASVQFVRISPRKVRYVIRLIRKKSVPEAQAILNGSPRRAADMIRKLLNQAVDAAVRNSHADVRNLVVSKALADGGPSMKRFRAGSMGRASVILKRTSHLLIELDLKKQTAPVSATKHPVSGSAGVKVSKSSPVKKAGQIKKVSEKKMAGVK
jgi:large subunit ribosomal protein L22